MIVYVQNSDGTWNITSDGGEPLKVTDEVRQMLVEAAADVSGDQSQTLVRLEITETVTLTKFDGEQTQLPAEILQLH